MDNKAIVLWLNNAVLCHIDYNPVNMAQIYYQFYLQLIGVDHAAIHYGIIGVKSVPGRRRI